MMSFEQVTGGYRRVPRVFDLEMIFPDGAFTALIGPNGSGKTTALRLAARLLRPMQGKIFLDGVPIDGFLPKEYARKVSLLPQSREIGGILAETLVSHGRFPYLGYPRRLQETDRDRVRQAMETAGVWEYRSRSVASLSGGERQRVYLAMTLAQDTPLVLLDEPGASLDIRRQLELLELAKQLRNQGRAVVMVLHDLSQALTYADRVVLLESGRKAFEGTPDALYRTGMLEQVFGVTVEKTACAQGVCYQFTLPR